MKNLETGAALGRGRLSPVRIGRLLGALDELGVADSTLVFLSSDNGPAIRRKQLGMSGSVLNLSGRKHCLFDGGTRFPFTVRWPGHTPPGHVNDDPRNSVVDLVPTFPAAAGIAMPVTWKPDVVSAWSALHGQAFRRGIP